MHQDGTLSRNMAVRRRPTLKRIERRTPLRVIPGFGPTACTHRCAGWLPHPADAAWALGSSQVSKYFNTEQKGGLTEDHGEDIMALPAVFDSTPREAPKFLTAPWSSVSPPFCSVLKALPG